MSIARRVFAVAIVAGCCASAVRAEVAAETDVFGSYLRTVVSSNTAGRNMRIWSVGRVRPTRWPLNPSGDSNGDLAPYVAENLAQGRWPWVAWSRSNGADYDLAWSRWTGRGWTQVAMVEAVPGPGNALDPAMIFDQSGRPYVVWVSKPASGPSQIYISVFLATRWMAPFRVSEPGENGTDPSIVIPQDGTIEVTYTVGGGPVTRVLWVTRPWTITDDITPFGMLSVADPRR